jgi:hypothetical protein
MGGTVTIAITACRLMLRPGQTVPCRIAATVRIL